jgi:hypothetical protein
MHARTVRLSACTSKLAKCCEFSCQQWMSAYASSHALCCAIWSCAHDLELRVQLTDSEAGYGHSIIFVSSNDNSAAMFAMLGGFEVGFYTHSKILW